MRLFLICCMLSITLVSSAKVRERITYGAKYAFMKGGEAELIISDTIYQGKKLTHYYIRGYSIGLTKMIFNVNDIYETILDDKNIIPYLHIRNASENKYRFYNETRFFYQSDSICSTKSGCKSTPKGMLDALSFYAAMRQKKFTDKLKVGQKFDQHIYHADDHFNMSSTYEGKATIDTEIGRRECYVISPIISDSKILAGSDALKIYITADEQRIPVIIELEMAVGKVSGYITSYKKYD